MLNFISIRILKRFFKENCNFIINSFEIKYCSFKKNGEYWRNVRGILAENGPARRNFGPERPGPAEIQARPARPSPLKFAARPDLSSLRFTTLLQPGIGACLKNVGSRLRTVTQKSFLSYCYIIFLKKIMNDRKSL